MDIITSKKILPQQKKKVKNILIRRCGCKQVESYYLRPRNSQHPENAFLVKYFPKHYHSLTLMMKPHHSLLSEIKRIKKLKRFDGIFLSRTPQVRCFKILGNNRKEIERVPQILELQNFNWAQTTLQAVKFFFNLAYLLLPPFQNYLSSWGALSKHLSNMRKLKIFKINTFGRDTHFLKSLFKKLNRMSRLLQQLEVFKAWLRSDVPLNLVLQNKNAFAHLTNIYYLSVSPKVSKFGQIIPKICKNLKLFSLTPEEISLFRSRNSIGFMIPVFQIPYLQSISIHWSNSWSGQFWADFIPTVCLRRLKLQLRAEVLEYVFFDHWKEITELDVLDLSLFCANYIEMTKTQDLITKMLKKVSKLASFECQIKMKANYVWIYQPFSVEEVPHIYEHMKKSKVNFALFTGFDFQFLKYFQNLKEIEFQGTYCFWRNIRDTIISLEGNMKKGEFSTLKLGSVIIRSQEELKSLLMNISRETNLKIILALQFQIRARDDEIMYLDQFCEVIESNPTKGLEISLDIRHQDSSECNVDEVKRVLDKHSRLKNFVLFIFYNKHILEYFKRDGEKEKLLYDRYGH